MDQKVTLWKQTAFLLWLLAGPCFAFDTLWNSFTISEVAPELEGSFGSLDSHDKINNLNFQEFNLPTDLSTQGEAVGSSDLCKSLWDEWLLDKSQHPDRLPGKPEHTMNGICIPNDSPYAIPITSPGAMDFHYPAVGQLENAVHSHEEFSNHFPSQERRISLHDTMEHQIYHDTKTPGVLQSFQDDLDFLIPSRHLSTSNSFLPLEDIQPKELFDRPFFSETISEISSGSNKKGIHDGWELTNPNQGTDHQNKYEQKLSYKRNHFHSSGSLDKSIENVRPVTLSSVNTALNPTDTGITRALKILGSKLYAKNIKLKSNLEHSGTEVISRNTLPFSVHLGKKTFFPSSRCARVSLASWRSQHCIFPLFIHKVTELDDLLRDLNIGWPFEINVDALESSLIYFKSWLNEEVSQFTQAISEGIQGKDPSCLYNNREKLLTKEQSHEIFWLEFSSLPEKWIALSWRLLQGWIDTLGPQLRVLFEDPATLRNFKLFYVRKATAEFYVYDQTKDHKKLLASYNQEYNFPKSTVDIRRALSKRIGLTKNW
ncbi:hypothetical protein DFH28DRAFT_1084656 [Melampsora americana]|nr:hypothetical protein DFH28DRAFT_1084656 [Melampsora americana]